ncbi:MAG: uroporphyrinogen-III synthase [Sulfurimonas sp.]|nr:uroporphyrinogen-III synthase [Sulfurimonas sp.]MDQ7059807.1 uroporphyrinogen-III synthase [Sulfurimonas sp.]
MKPNIYLFSVASNPQVISINSLDITFLKPSVDFSKYDYFILTSKQAVNSLNIYTDISLKPALCISKETAKAYQMIGGKVLDIGLGYGDSLEKKIREYSQEVKWLYLRAEIIASNFVLDLQKDKYIVDESILYRSKCSQAIKDVEVKEGSTLIFTSPSSVKCFLKNNLFDVSFKVIVIGKTTASALPDTVKYSVSKKKTIISCIKLANEK